MYGNISLNENCQVDWNPLDTLSIPYMANVDIVTKSLFGQIVSIWSTGYCCGEWDEPAMTKLACPLSMKGGN